MIGHFMNKNEIKDIEKVIDSWKLQSSSIFMNMNDYNDIASWAWDSRIYDWVFYD